MNMQKEEKTNVMRLLDAKKIAHESYFFDCSSVPTGEEVAAILNKDARQVFKTLVTAGKSGAHYVFMVPVTGELDLKKAARAAGCYGIIACAAKKRKAAEPASRRQENPCPAANTISYIGIFMPRTEKQGRDG